MLGALIKLGGAARFPDIQEVGGYSKGRTHWAVQELLKLGSIARPYHGRWCITERGKIVYALLQGKAMRRAAVLAASAFGDNARR